MKKIFTLSTLVLLFLSACTPATSQMEEEKGKVEEEKVEIETNLQNLDISELNLRIQFPDHYTVEKNEIPHRRGSFLSYDFFHKTERNAPQLSAILFYSDQSIKEFEDYCKVANPCYFGDYPTPESVDRQKEALKNNQNIDGYEKKTFSDRTYFVRSFDCIGDSCRIREYSTFYKGHKMDVMVNLPEGRTDEEGDRIFEEIQILDQKQ